MLIDLTTAEECQGPALLTGRGGEVAFRRVAAAIWGEHCVECGAPACYGSCERFAPSRCGWCKRFEHGVVPVRTKDGHQGYAVQFRGWGKLELDTCGTAITPRQVRIVQLIDACLRPLVRGLTRLFQGTKPKTTHTFISAYRRRLDLLVKAMGRPCAYETWAMRCFAEGEEQLMASIFIREKGEVMVRPLDLKPGENEFVFDVRGVEKGAYFRIYSIKGTTRPIVFTELTVGSGASVGSVGEVHETRAARNEKAQPAQFVKCVAWDLDNTLWSGILVEDGLDGVKVNEEAVALIKTLDKRGIVHTVLSKNDHAEAWKALEKFGLAEYFVFPHINWNPKSANLAAAVREINIGANAFAFIDDSSFERGEVAEKFPSVRGFTEKDIGKIADLPEFNPPVSAESAQRRFSYLAEMSRRTSETVFAGSHEDFLRVCEIELTCLPVVEDSVRRRCWELVNRTNQLTLAANRYTENEFSALCDGGEAFAIHCKDKYGDYGIVGFVSVMVKGAEALVAEFVMSCRVAKKLCEQSVLLALAERLSASGVSQMRAKVVPTGRNVALVEAFDAMPFIKETREEKLEYRLDLPLSTAVRDVFRNPVSFG